LNARPDPEIQRYQPPDFDFANEKLDAMCGHGALAAALETTVAEAVGFLGRGGWINIPMMQRGIEVAGRGWRRHAQPVPGVIGVSMIQFVGPWCGPTRPPQARCRYRHWVASYGDYFWDINLPRWILKDVWAAIVIDSFKEEITGMTGWEIVGFYEICPADGRAPRPTVPTPTPKRRVDIQGDLFGGGVA
jgi:hypothetical protein